MSRPAEIARPYRRCFVDHVMKREGLHFALSRPWQNAAKRRTRTKRRAEGKRVCREAQAAA